MGHQPHTFPINFHVFKNLLLCVPAVFHAHSPIPEWKSTESSDKWAWVSIQALLVPTSEDTQDTSQPLNPDWPQFPPWNKEAELKDYQGPNQWVRLAFLVPEFHLQIP